MMFAVGETVPVKNQLPPVETHLIEKQPFANGKGLLLWWRRRESEPKSIPPVGRKTL